MRMAGRDLTLKNKTEVVVRTVRAAEAGQFVKFINRIYRSNDLLEYTSSEMKLIKKRKVRKKIKEFEKAKRQILLGVYHEGELVGICCVYRTAEREKLFHRAGLYIALDEAFRGTGLGASLMKMAFDFASKVAYEQFETTVLDGNTPAFILCTEYGFKAMCRFSRAFKNMKGAYQDSILLVKYLNNYEI